MPISDSKKVASAINHVGYAALDVRAAVDKMNAIIVKFQAANPDVTNTPLEGKKAAMLSAITSLDVESAKPVWDAVIDAISPSHRGEAL